ncbi:hypothetical protein ACM39_18650 [Chryseobacterium sp. FH2]|uniref:hypothetical protein n=1 Tax=Chryseobacterium sp. FH2 TaxID=1674291 RepID=UPI00065ADF3A|nr:hypothetical protein [Chryseobacterium sp. FH2]KMQ58343.1 hypothetical protein ACM39_18650 [Chryseobacterium sp. FH2]
MKLIIYITLTLGFTFSCAQQKFEKPPKSGESKIDKIKDALPTYILKLNELKKNNDSLYCINNNLKCRIIDGDVVIFTDTDFSNESGKAYSLYVEGSIKKGKYNDIWKYYDKNGKVIKKEKWDNGKLVYSKEYK